MTFYRKCVIVDNKLKRSLKIMSTVVTKVLDQVRTRKEAEEAVTALLLQYSGNTAFEYIREEAEGSKQSANEVTRRVVSNLFTRFSTRK